MTTDVVLGRPGMGKTEYLINALNEYDGSTCLVSLEYPEALIRKRGLKDTVSVLSLDLHEVTAETILAFCRETRPRLVAIDYLELLPLQVDLAILQKDLEAMGVRHFIITSQLRRDMKPCSQERINAIPCNQICLPAGN